MPPPIGSANGMRVHGACRVVLLVLVPVRAGQRCGPGVRVCAVLSVLLVVRTEGRGQGVCRAARPCPVPTHPTHPKPGHQLIHGRIVTKRGLIRLQIPRKAAHLHRGVRLRSITAFTTTAAGPQSATTIFNLIDAAAPFDVTIRR